MKKILLVLTLAIALILSIGLTACDKQAGSDKFSKLDTTQEVYAFSAASAGTLISSINGSTAQTAQTLSVKNVVSDEQTIADLNNYMALIESIISDGEFKILVETSDNAQYTNKEIISYKDLLGNTVEYTLYYNQTQKVDFDDDDDRRDKHEIEEEYSIEGIMVVDGVDYAILGEKETETEEGESESEIKFVVTLSENKYITVKQEIEEERGESERSFVYSIYENNSLVERSAFEYETERNETEIKFSFTKNGETQVFYFEEERGVIQIRVGDNQSSEKYIVTIIEDENGSYYQYEIAGKKYDKHRRHHK